MDNKIISFMEHMTAFATNSGIENTGSKRVNTLKVVTFKCGCVSHKCLVKGNKDLAGCSRDCAGCKDAHFVIPCSSHRGKKVTAISRNIRRVRLYN